MREKLAEDSFYAVCCLTGKSDAKIDWHHAKTYKGRQINEKWNIVPIIWYKHSPLGDKDSVHNCQRTKELAELVALNRATDDELMSFGKSDFIQRKKFLNKKYETLVSRGGNLLQIPD